ncbi:Collagen alpha-1(III) chain like [Melia azedarach]|uniref:Collagen alpha-1(III) chain like n=1 Tax=Melia azedarach TaxID=155640 RepID=A0ACC1YGB1_MELAZ|nr:Collagen alpha-1(III) chain like [Melia azedarach]
MSNKSPIFPMPDPQHFSDYGFDPQIDYFQVLEEARKHKRETSSSRSMDSLHFKLQKPISKDEARSKKSHNKAKKKRWWRNALLFFKWKWIHHNSNHVEHDDLDLDLDHDVHNARARAFRASISGPVYITESRSGSSTPHRSTSRPSSGPLAGTLSPVNKTDVQIPYLSLRDLNMEQQQQQRMSTSSLPIYLVT